MAKFCGVCQEKLPTLSSEQLTISGIQVCSACFENSAEEKRGSSSGRDPVAAARAVERYRQSQRFPFLRVLANIYRILGVFSLVVGVVYFFVCLIATEYSSALTALFIFPWAAILAFSVAEGIRLFVDIENNTRKSAWALEKMVSS